MAIDFGKDGGSVDDLPFFPNSSKRQITRTKTQIRDRLKRIQAEIHYGQP